MQLKTRIIVDSTADLVPEIKERVYTVPLTVHFGQEEYIDGVTIDNKTFYEKLVESDVLPTTSQAAPNDFIKEFEKAKQAGEAAVVITLASRFSGTYQSAVIAAELLASSSGIGFMIQQCRGLARPDIIIAGMIAIGLIGTLLTWLLGLLEKLVLKGGNSKR